MDQSDQDLDRLGALLHALPAENVPMTLSELDGYVVGVLACPDMIPPSEWMPPLWGETGEAKFPDQKTAEDTIGAVMAHYNSVAEAITRSPWVDGFTRDLEVAARANAHDAGQTTFVTVSHPECV